MDADVNLGFTFDGSYLVGGCEDGNDMTSLDLNEG